MRRKTVRLVVMLAFVLLTAPLATHAQPSATLPKIGHLALRAGPAAEDEVFKQELRDLGWIEGQTIAMEYRWAAGQVDRLPALAEELVRLQVACIVAWSTPAVQAAKDATPTIPIVMTWVADPIRSGFAASLARPGGNITGTSNIQPELAGRSWNCLEPCYRASPAWPSWPMGVIQSTSSSYRTHRTLPRASAWRCSQW